MAGILIIADATTGPAAPAFLELATAGAALAQASGEPLIGALIGDDNAANHQSLAAVVNTLYLIEGSHDRVYTAQSCIAAAQAAIAATSPSIVLFAHTLEAREWVPQLAARLDAGLVMDCIALGIEDDALVVTKPVYGGGVWGEFAIRGIPRMATLRSGIFEPAVAGSRRELVRLPVTAPSDGAVTVLDQAAAAAGGGVKLKDAKIIVAGGRGLGGADNWHFIEDAAAALGAAVACSRPLADSGWVPSAYQVGLSGTSVKPDVYIAVGISGAVQHVAGISAARTVVAINTDADADIFTRADYGVVGDYREVLPAFIERIKQLQS
ncbi:MAG TPA: electron transfer flavoprotein subunit alpha/FixB family protein [Burkholderiales bacterium]|jgi:electron transfer flavoprotein alpha subunit|nr:electron transfer flavoprotein subunit alpha/FixB family protein [Burkholderiales bacterium]